MAYEGQVVKLENGRWARFRHLDVQGNGTAPWDAAILVAVELDERYQSMLDAAARSLEAYGQGGVEMQLTLAADERGEMSVRVEEAFLH